MWRIFSRIFPPLSGDKGGAKTPARQFPSAFPFTPRGAPPPLPKRHGGSPQTKTSLFSPLFLFFCILQILWRIALRWEKRLGDEGSYSHSTILKSGSIMIHACPASRFSSSPLAFTKEKGFPSARFHLPS